MAGIKCNLHTAARQAAITLTKQVYSYFQASLDTPITSVNLPLVADHSK